MLNFALKSYAIYFIVIYRIDNSSIKYLPSYILHNWKFFDWNDMTILYNIDISDQLTGKFALCISLALKLDTYKLQETRFLAAYQYWTTGSLIGWKH